MQMYLASKSHKMWALGPSFSVPSFPSDHPLPASDFSPIPLLPSLTIHHPHIYPPVPLLLWHILAHPHLQKFLGLFKVIPSSTSSLSRFVIISEPRLGNIFSIVASFISAAGIDTKFEVWEGWWEAHAFAIPAAFRLLKHVLDSIIYYRGFRRYTKRRNAEIQKWTNEKKSDLISSLWVCCTATIYV